MPQIAPPTQPTVSVQVPVPTPVEPAPQSQPAAARPNQDFLDGYAAALQQQGKGKGKDEEPPADPDAKPAAVSLPPPQPDTDRRQQVVPHTLIFPYLPSPRKRFRPRARYARVSEFTRHPEYHALLSQITPWDKQNDAGDVGHGVLADWLEDRGFPAVARHIRESAALAPEMPGDISPRYGLPGRTQVQPGQPVMDTLHSPSTGKARIVLRLPDKYTPAGDATRMIGVDRRWISHYMTPAEAARRVREMGREGVALFRHSTGPGAFGPGGVRHINTDASAARRYARYSEIARHPDVIGLLRSHEADPGSHVILADRLEELGLPAVASHLRSANPDSIHASRMAYLPEHMRRPLERGQPVVHWNPVHTPAGDGASAPRLADVRLLLPSGGGGYRAFRMEGIAAPHAARHLRALSHDGVAVHTVSATYPYHEQVVNTDAAARRRMARPRKYAAQRAWATWQSLHPEIRHTPLGAALVHVANGHGGDETATHLAYAAVHAAGEHDSPMKLEPIGVLADYLEDNNPGHPLARAFNLNGITNKLELDRLVEAHAAQMAHGADRPAAGHDWTHYELNNIKAGSSPESPLREPLARAVAAAQTAGYRATPEDVVRSAARTASRRFLSLDVAHRIWNPDDYHDQVGRQVMADASPTAITPPDDPRRFSRAIATAIGASE